MKDIYNAERKFKFSIIMAIYNTEKYLCESIESILNQDIGFRENIQLILVDDGSSDNSLKLCKDYYSQYPDNIKIIESEHAGVSEARNKGLRCVEGDYVNFLDSDDKLESNACSAVYNWIELNKDEVDVIAIPLYFFDGDSGEHILNSKFKENRIINVVSEPTSIQLSASSCFIKVDATNEIKFDSNLKYAEDAKWITSIILKKGSYAVLNNTKYFYRRRIQDKSATQKAIDIKSWYIDYIKNFSLDLMEYKQAVDLKYNKYIQNLVMYDLQWRIGRLKEIKSQVNKEEKEYILSLISEVVKNIDIDIIIKQENLTCIKKIYCLIMKYIKNSTRGGKFEA